MTPPAAAANPYVWDTSALLGSWVRNYPPDRFPSFWTQMDGLVAAGRLLCPEEVLEELKAQDDELYGWVLTRKSAIVVPTTRALLLEAKDVLADHPHLTKTGTGRGKADPFVIALAAQASCSVVTTELGGSQSKPRIPYVCGARGVECLPILDVIRTEGWTF